MYGYYDRRRYEDPYKDYDWDNDGYPGEFVYGEGVYLDDEYMDELWKRTKYFPNYWVSNRGRMYSPCKDKFIYGSPLKSGHIDVSLRINGVRRHALMHRVVAEAFLPNPNNLPVVRHIDNDPSYNDISNLIWGTQLNNVHDCIRSGNFKYFTKEDVEAANAVRRTPVTAINLRTRAEINYISQQEAARDLGISQSSIYRVLSGRSKHAGGYYFYYTDKPTPIDASTYKYSRHNYPIKAIETDTGEEYVFGNQTETAEALGMSVASVSTVLSGKARQAKGYIFEYFDEEERYD